MAYRPRSLDELSVSIRGLFRQYLPGTDASVRQNVLYVLAKVLALLAREYELRIEWIFRQLFLSTATDDGHVRMHAADYRIYQKAAAPSAGTVTGVGGPGTTYPAGVRFLAGGTTFVSTAPFTADGSGVFSAAVTSEARGAATNRGAGAVLLVADPALYPTLPAELTVGAGGLGGGADVEDIESLRSRALARKSMPPQGGALPDYEQFALAVPGVVKAWAYPFTGGIGTIGIYVLFSGRPNLIPTPADIAIVQASIEARRLIRVDDATAIAPVPSAVAVAIAGLSSDTPEVRASIEENIRAVFFARVRPGIDADPFILSRSWISEAISAATGEDRHALVAPASDPVFSGGSIPVLGPLTYA